MCFLIINVNYSYKNNIKGKRVRFTLIKEKKGDLADNYWILLAD